MSSKSNDTGSATDRQPDSTDNATGALERREFLTRLWVAGGGLTAAAGLWTSWDLLKPLPTVGFGGVVRAVAPEAVTAETVVEIPAARAYLTRVEGEVVALSQKCTHLGCRVPFCAASGRFECPCHGSVFNRAGDYLAGPAPRGMDKYPVDVGEDGLLRINTGESENGLQVGEFSIDDTEVGKPGCATEGH